MSDLVAAYLFCAGAGSGAAFLTALYGLVAGRRAAGPGSPRVRAELTRVALASYGAALALLVFGMLCLVFDLGRPDLALKLFLRPHPTMMTLGSYALAALAAALVALIALELRAPRRAGAPGPRRARVAAQVAAVVAAACVMVYAGLLLGASDEAPLLTTPWLPVLFVASALASGLAVAMLALALAGSPRLPAVRALAGRLTVRADIVLIAAEAVAAAAYLASAGAGPAGLGAAAPLLAGDEAGLFVGGFAVIGMAVPLALDLAQLRGALPGWAYPLAAAATLIGAACLRVAVIHAGSPVLEAPLLALGFA